MHFRELLKTMHKHYHIYSGFSARELKFQSQHKRIGLLFSRAITFFTLFCSIPFADGIILKNGMQLVITIRDTAGDSISIQEGMWAGKIAKSLITSFWYNGHRFLAKVSPAVQQFQL